MHGVVDGALLVGREPELSLIAARLADREHGIAIVIRGAAGIGKTALVEEAVRLASPGQRILRTFGSAPEAGPVHPRA
jgi:predicted ATPase